MILYDCYCSERSLVLGTESTYLLYIQDSLNHDTYKLLLILESGAHIRLEIS